MSRDLFVFSIIASVLIFLIVPSSCSEDMSNVVKVTNENIREVLLGNNTGVVFIRCHLPYCQACLDFGYAWNKVAQFVKDHATVCDINCENESDWCEVFLKCHMFPEFIVFENGKRLNKWRGSYSGWDLVDYIKNKEYLD